MPNARAWLPQIEQYAGRALGLVVRIGDIELPSSAWVPSLELRDVVLLDHEQREVLRLPRVSAVPSARSLLAFELRLQQLWIDGAEVELRRDALGRLHLAGFALDGGDGGDALVHWFFRQREFVVRGARLRWVDEQRLAPPLALQAVDIVVRNGLRRREFRLDATPDTAWGERFSLRGQFLAPLLGDGGDWRRFRGELYAELPRVDLSQLRRHVALPFELHEGDGALRAWIDWAQGEPTAATLDLALRALSLRLLPTAEPLALQRLQARLRARQDAGTIALAADDLRFVDDAGQAWPAGDLQLTLRRRPGAHGDQPFSGGELRADRLDLALLATLAQRLPLGEPLRRLLEELQPAGRVEPLHARWDGTPDAPARYRVQAGLHGLALAARPSPQAGGLGRPGLHGAHIELDANEAGGQASLRIDDGGLVLPGVFEQSELALQRLAARLDWRLGRRDGAAPSLELQVREATFANADARGSFTARWRSGDGAGVGRGGRWPGRLELRGRLDEGRADAVARYLPLALPETTRRYVERAVQGGRLRDGQFRVAGDLWDFPYADGSAGVFRISGHAEGLRFAYVPDEPGAVSPWPAFDAVAGELEFDRASMVVRNGVARVYGVELSGVQATIADLTADAPLLQLDGHAEGPAADLLRYVAASPVGRWLDDALAQAQIDGRGALQLAIRVPLADPERSTVDGSLTLAGNDVRIAPALPRLAGARGRVVFSDRGFALEQVQAQAYGGAVALSGGLQDDGTLRLEARGHARIEALRGEMPLPLAPVAAALAGATDYRLQLQWQGDGAPALELDSDLVGVAIDLPPPLAKRREAPLPLRLRRLPASTAAGADEWMVDLGTLVQARYRLGGAASDAVVGGIGIGVPAPAPAAGVAALVVLPQLDADAWRAAFERATAAGGAAPAGGAAAAWLPQRVGLQLGELRHEGRVLTNLVAGLSTGGAAPWRATVDADQIAGYLEWRPGPAAGGPGGVMARLSRLALPPASNAPVERWLDRPPSSVPALDIVVERFELGPRQLGRVELGAVNQPLAPAVAGGPGGHEWRLERLRLDNADARLDGSGVWRAATADTPARMTVEFELDIDDAGALLARLGMPDALRGGHGRLQGAVSWQGSPLAPHAPTTNGRLQLAMRDGQFLQADSRAARVLSVLSLQALPRRLVLDFRDVFEQGFVFDDASGDVTIVDGVARTNNLRMRGLQAAVLMEGQADLVHETQDLRVIVVPEINAGTASLAYSIINPMVGLGTFVAQLFLRQPLMQAGTREFHVSGGWSEPKVDRVERAAVAPPAPADGAATANPVQ